ncbi:MAG: amino acid ABC transporter permease [Actinomyces succiniciruminis]|uniref:Glutamine ABC super ATP binding cassette transporter, membrane protein n=1 Tax=Actinomyces succiniciruminis TaxID=1522002 RepID=A0A1L7RAV8_9ACTO|nr:amino acid ABC transporter permease [Actinomyces succiniciruminis]MBE6473984.1 amino acid ABC transporter permease [Actinomyces succiniciruminis]MBM6979398.1 amino acid ABC transporter permease [Actinomyces succiniciruminis]CED90997.1 Glutamine ABC super ATP binding cassette transporter, membrane protein [Actinomyces succiniciruminis]
MNVITDNLGMLGQGLVTTLTIAVIGYACALVVGTVIAIFRVSPIPPLRALGTAWVTVACNIPTLCLMILAAFAAPRAGVPLSLFAAAVTAIVFSASGFVCETVRSGINSVSKGQIEAARALGMPFGLIIAAVVLPQALARTIQPLVNIFISCLIGSSLAAAIGVPELTNVTQQLNLRYAQAVITFLTSGLTYLAIAFLATKLGGLLERRVTGREARA